MKLKSQNAKTKIIIVVFVVLFVLIMTSSGMTEFSSGTKIGYVSDKGKDHWSAHYISIDGTFLKTIYPEDGQDTLYIKTETSEGRISITVEDRNSNILYRNDDTVNDEFRLKIDGKVKIRIEADKHKGSFDIRCE